MRILSFIDKYCQDLVEDNKRERKLFDFSEFPNDGTVTDSEGNIIPIVVNFEVPKTNPKKNTIHEKDEPIFTIDTMAFLTTIGL